MTANSPQTRALFKTDRWDAVTFASLTILLVVAAWVALSTTINHDSAWYLHATRVFLDGGRLYEDIIEINPPLAFLLTVPPVWAADVTGLFAVDLFFIWLFGLTAASLVLSWAVLRGLPDLTPTGRRALVFAVLFALVLGAWRELGQREHLLLVFCFPYLFLIALRVAGGSCGRGLGVVVGAFAMLGLALKPYFLLLPLVMEGYLFLKSKSVRGGVRPETVALAACLTIYALAVVAFSPAFFTRILPLGIAVYDAYASSFVFVFNTPEMLLLAAVLLVRGWAPRDASLGKIIDVFMIAAVTFFFAYLVQMKGWPYQRIPAASMLLFVLAPSLIGSLSRYSATGAWRALAVFSVLLAVVSGWLVKLGSYQNSFLTPALAITRTVPPGAPVFVFTSNVSHAFPLVNYAGATWSSRYPALWTIPGVMRRQAKDGVTTDQETRDNLSAIEDYTFDTVVGDLIQRPPALIFVDVRARKPYFGRVVYDYLAHFSTDPRFAALWSHYEKFTEIDEYEVYRRTETPGRRSP